MAKKKRCTPPRSRGSLSERVRTPEGHAPSLASSPPGLFRPTRSPILAPSAYAVKATDTGRIPWKMHTNRPSQRPTTRN